MRETSTLFLMRFPAKTARFSFENDRQDLGHNLKGQSRLTGRKLFGKVHLRDRAGEQLLSFSVQRQTASVGATSRSGRFTKPTSSARRKCDWSGWSSNKSAEKVRKGSGWAGSKVGKANTGNRKVA